MGSSELNKQVPAIAGWFSWPVTDKPYLIGSRCDNCGSYFFPKVKLCGNPKCQSTDLKDTPLSRNGKLFTYTINYFKPPSPYIAPDPFVPYAVAVMDFEKEKMKIMGQIVTGYDLSKLRVGMDLEVVLDVLYRDEEERDVMVWKFKPV